MKKLIGILALWISAIICFANDVPTYKVIAVIDGNTIQIMATNGEQMQILIHGVDCPEEGQNYAREAKQLIESLLLNKMVTVIERGKDRNGNRIAEVKAKDVPDVRIELVRSGLAWTTIQDEELERRKEHARDQGLGLWAEENPMPPWQYRRQQSMLKPKAG